MSDLTTAPAAPEGLSGAGSAVPAERPRPRPTPEQAAGLQHEVLGAVPALRAFARSLSRNAADADDLVQETLAKALASIHQFRPGTNLRAWLFTILRNTHYTGTRRLRRETTDPDPGSFRRATVGPDQEWSVTMGKLKWALDQLSPEHRDVLLLVTAAGLNYDEAAEVCGCAVGTIKSRVSRARGRLLEVLEANGADDVLVSDAFMRSVTG